MRFLADMGVSPRCVEWLRAQGHDAIHLFEQGLHKLPDQEVLKKAKIEKRILLTMDLDFARLLSCSKAKNLPNVVIFRISDQRPGNVQTMIEAILPLLKENIGADNSIVSVSDDKVRIRRLPVK